MCSVRSHWSWQFTGGWAAASTFSLALATIVSRLIDGRLFVTIDSFTELTDTIPTEDKASVTSAVELPRTDAMFVCAQSNVYVRIILDDNEEAHGKIDLDCKHRLDNHSPLVWTKINEMNRDNFGHYRSYPSVEITPIIIFWLAPPLYQTRPIQFTRIATMIL